MSDWPATKAPRALRALQRIGWRIVRTSGSHRTLRREGWPQYRFAYHDKEELGPVALAEMAKHTGLRPEDL
jgi:predicted RNA binding protein YcfA (HicA-like mRNA interferase family)